VQSIVNAENKFAIPPSFDEEESDAKELPGKVSLIQHTDCAQFRSIQSELSTSNDTDQHNNKLTVFQEIPTPFEPQRDISKDLPSFKQSYSNSAVNNVSIPL